MDESEVFTSASIGIAVSTTEYSHAEDIIRDADIAMYRAKSMGKARYELFDEAMHGRAVELLQLETDLRKAVDREEFRLYYQPIVSLESGDIVGFEASFDGCIPRVASLIPQHFCHLRRKLA